MEATSVNKNRVWTFFEILTQKFLGASEYLIKYRKSIVMLIKYSEAPKKLLSQNLKKRSHTILVHTSSFHLTLFSEVLEWNLWEHRPLNN